VASSNKKVFCAHQYFHQFSLGNASSINYDINFIQLTIVNKKQLKKSAGWVIAVNPETSKILHSYLFKTVFGRPWVV